MLLAIFGLVAISCNDREEDVIVQENVIPNVMLDVTGSFNAGNNYLLSKGITLNNTDIVLVYRNTDVNNSSNPYWQLLPKTEYLKTGNDFDGRELDYNFNFDRETVDITTLPNFPYSGFSTSEQNLYLNNQKFRIVLIPAQQGRLNIDYADYESVVKYFNLDETKVKNL